jgi:hypothetical protein
MTLPILVVKIHQVINGLRPIRVELRNNTLLVGLDIVRKREKKRTVDRKEDFVANGSVAIGWWYLQPQP